MFLIKDPSYDGIYRWIQGAQKKFAIPQKRTRKSPSQQSNFSLSYHSVQKSASLAISLLIKPSHNRSQQEACVNNALITIPSTLPEAAPARREFKYLKGIPSSEKCSALCSEPLLERKGKKPQTNCEEFNGSSTWSALSKASAESDGGWPIMSASPSLTAILEGCNL